MLFIEKKMKFIFFYIRCPLAFTAFHRPGGNTSFHSGTYGLALTLGVCFTDLFIFYYSFTITFRTRICNSVLAIPHIYIAHPETWRTIKNDTLFWTYTRYGLPLYRVRSILRAREDIHLFLVNVNQFCIGRFAHAGQVILKGFTAMLYHSDGL